MTKVTTVLNVERVLAWELASKRKLFIPQAAPKGTSVLVCDIGVCPAFVLQNSVEGCALSHDYIAALQKGQVEFGVSMNSIC